jgi:hypothetical protein
MMNRRIDELLIQRGRLIERIDGQREAICRDIVPVATALDRIDFVVAGIRSGAGYLCRHALVTSAVVGALLIFRGRASLRWARRAFSLWNSWRALRNLLSGLEDRIRP